MYDNGDLIGITEEQCIESIMVLYYMARSIEAEIKVTKVRLGRDEYNVQLQVTKDLSGAYDLINGTKMPMTSSNGVGGTSTKGDGIGGAGAILDSNNPELTM